MSEEQEQPAQEEMSDEEALMKIAQAMGNNVANQDEKTNVHTFLRDVVITPDVTRVGNLHVDKDYNELGLPEVHVRGLKQMSLISKHIMNNNFFENYFEEEAQDVLATSLSAGGFLVRQATVQTKNVADVTKRRRVQKGIFGKEKVEEQGGDPYATQ